MDFMKTLSELKLKGMVGIVVAAFLFLAFLLLVISSMFGVDISRAFF